MISSRYNHEFLTLERIREDIRVIHVYKINKSDLSFLSNRQGIMGKLINKLMFLLEFPQLYM